MIRLLTIGSCLVLPAALLAQELRAQDATPPDPRQTLVSLQLEGRHEAALTEVERLLALEPERAQSLGLDYLRGHLLDRLGRQKEAAEAYLASLSSTPKLSGYIYYNLALSYERVGHPEMAAGLVARVVGDGTRFGRLGEAISLLTRALAQGGDCRLLAGIDDRRFQARERRPLRLAKAECLIRDGKTDEAKAALAALLREERGDETALRIARLAVAGAVDSEDRALRELVGLTLHAHRDFEVSSQVLDDAFRREGAPHLLTDRQWDARYARARNDFWTGAYSQAAIAYGRLANRTRDTKRQAKAIFQRGRCLELLGNWTAAVANFRRAFQADSASRWADASLISAMRLEWRRGKETEALEYYGLLIGDRRWRRTAARASLFLSASDLVLGRGDRSGAWLDDAARSGAANATELAYWRGRQAEVNGQQLAAVQAYLAAIRNDAFHPLAIEARKRLEQPNLGPMRQAEGQRLAALGTSEGLTGAWLLLGEGSQRGRSSLASLALRLRQDARARDFMAVGEVPVDRWPIWNASLQRADEVLLSLGLWSEGNGAVGRHFPVNQPALALTGSRLLAANGETQRAVYLAEILAKRLPDGLPERLMPDGFRRVLFPLNHIDILVGEATARGLDPALVAGIIREESRFDADALSAAAARGLMQLTLPTARRYSEAAGVESLEALDLYRPEVAIALGTTYLADLMRRFQGFEPAVVAAYNAGEDQAEAWRKHCFSDDPAEFFSKVSFRETQAYVRKVLTSRAQYRDIYRGELEPSVADGRNLRTTGGSSARGSSR